MKVCREHTYHFECDLCSGQWSVEDYDMHNTLASGDFITINCPYCQHAAQLDDSDVMDGGLIKSLP